MKIIFYIYFADFFFLVYRLLIVLLPDVTLNYLIIVVL